MNSLLALPRDQQEPLKEDVRHVLRLHKNGVTEQDWEDLCDRTKKLAKRVGDGKRMIYAHQKEGKEIVGLLTFYQALIDVLAFYYFYLEHAGFSYFAREWQTIMDLSA